MLFRPVPCSRNQSNNLGVINFYHEWEPVWTMLGNIWKIYNNCACLAGMWNFCWTGGIQNLSETRAGTWLPKSLYDLPTLSLLKIKLSHFRLRYSTPYLPRCPLIPDQFATPPALVPYVLINNSPPTAHLAIVEHQRRWSTKDHVRPH